MKKAIIAIIIITITTGIFASIPVTDPVSTMLERIEFLKKVKKWTATIRQLKEVLRNFADYYKHFKQVYQGFHHSVIAKYRDLLTIKPNEYETMPHYYDGSSKDPFAPIFKGVLKIEQMFPAMGEDADARLLIKDRYYQINKTYRDWIDGNRKNKAVIDASRQAIYNMIGQQRLAHRYRKNSLTAALDQLMDYAEKRYGPVPVSPEGKTKIVAAQLLLMRLQVKHDINNLLKAIMDHEIKKYTLLLDSIKRKRLIKIEKEK